MGGWIGLDHWMQSGRARARRTNTHAFVRNPEVSKVTLTLDITRSKEDLSQIFDRDLAPALAPHQPPRPQIKYQTSNT